MRGVAFSLGFGWHTNSGCHCGISNILPHQAHSPCLSLRSLPFSCLRGQLQAGEGGPRVGGSYEDSLRPRRGKRGWREFFRTGSETTGLAGEWAAGFKYGCEPRYLISS